MTETTDAKRHFFISFTGADRPWARWLASTLTEEGYTYWFQDQDFAGPIPGSIAKAHERSDRTILLLSDAYARSDYTRSEWEARYMQDPGGAKDLLIPFRVGPCTVSDPLLKRLAFHDLFDKDEPAARELVRQRLLQAVKPGHRVPLGHPPFPGTLLSAPFPGLTSTPQRSDSTPKLADQGKVPTKEHPPITALIAVAIVLIAVAAAVIFSPNPKPPRHLPPEAVDLLKSLIRYVEEKDNVLTRP